MWKIVGETAFFESGEFAFGSAIYTVAHGLGGTPKTFSAIIRCKVAENGYSVGDEIDVTTGGYYNWFMNSMLASSTLLTFMTYTPSYFVVHNRTNPNQGGMWTASATNWVLVLRAWR